MKCAAGMAVAMAVACGAWTAGSGRTAADAPPAEAVLRELAVDPATAARILALDPDRITDHEIRETLGRAPAPRILLFHGSVPIVTMQPFGEFLAGMGYPRERLRNPVDGRYTQSSFADSRQIAGTLAWYYEREGMVPMLIGHSQGGMLTIKVLQDLAEPGGAPIAVWNPVTDEPDGRSSVVDPVSGAERPVAGLRVPYAAALATGSLMRVLLGQWGMVSRLRTVPDSVAEFTGFFVEWDPIAGTSPGSAARDPYRPAGSAQVRNVTLPADYGHISLPLAAHLAAEPATRAWIERYSPRAPLEAPPSAGDVDARNILHAADIWYSVKRHWCLEAQRIVRATRRAVAR